MNTIFETLSSLRSEDTENYKAQLFTATELTQIH